MSSLHHAAGVSRLKILIMMDRWQNPMQIAQVVNVNDFAMNSMICWRQAGWIGLQGVTSPDYRVFRFHPDKPQPVYLGKIHLFQMPLYQSCFYRLGHKGI